MPLVGNHQARFDVADVWCRHGETVLRRMGGHDLLWGWFFQGRSQVWDMKGKITEAVKDLELAIAAKERALGPDAPDVGISVGGLAVSLANLGLYDRAIEESERAIRILSAGFGPAHPSAAIYLSNLGEYLCRVGRFAEAREPAKRALAIMERETDPASLFVSYPLLTQGLVHIGIARSADAVRFLERAVGIREALGSPPVRLAEVHFALARALQDRSGEDDRAVALARQARREYEQAPRTPIVEGDLVEIDRWLAAHAPEAR